MKHVVRRGAKTVTVEAVDGLVRFSVTEGSTIRGWARRPDVVRASLWIAVPIAEAIKGGQINPIVYPAQDALLEACDEADEQRRAT